MTILENSSPNAGNTDIAARLYDQAYSSIEYDDDAGELDNFRIERTLSPGIYYVEVEGRFNATGDYARWIFG